MNIAVTAHIANSIYADKALSWQRKPISKKEIVNGRHKISECVFPIGVYPRNEKGEFRTEIDFINNDLCLKENAFHDLNIETLIDWTAFKGVTIVPAILKPINDEIRRKEENFNSTEIVALDIDHGNYEAFYNKACKLGLKPTFTVETFSSFKNGNGIRFRAYWTLEGKVVSTHVLRDIIYKCLMLIFSDQKPDSTFDPCRLFYGSNKGTLDVDTEAVLNIEHLINVAVQTIRENNPTNEARSIKKFCREMKVKCVNNRPAIWRVIDENAHNSNNNTFLKICEVSSNSKNGVLYFEFDMGGAYQKQERQRPKNWNIKSWNGCQLIKKALTGKKWLYHYELYHIMLNLLDMEGGKKKFMDILDSRPEYSDSKYGNKKYEFEQLWEQYSKTRLYSASACNTSLRCDFQSQCGWTGLIETKVKRSKSKKRPVRHVEIKTKPLEVASEEFKQEFDSALQRKGITALKVTTGLGKTRYACETLARTGIKARILAPRHDLCQQIEHTLIEMNVPCRRVLPPPTPEEVKAAGFEIEAYQAQYAHLQSLRNKGLFESAKWLLKDMSETFNEDGHPFSKYWTNNIELEEWDGNLVMTHEQHIFWKGSMKQEVVICDEDIIPQLLKQGTTPLAAVTSLKAHIADYKPITLKHKGKTYIDSFKAEYDFLQSITDAPIDKVTPISFKGSIKAVREVFKGVFENEDSNLLELFHASHIYKYVNGNGVEKVSFVVKRKLPNATQSPFVILSATINEFDLKKLFPKSVFKDNGEVAHKGNLKWYFDPTESYSKSSLNKSKGKFKRVLDNIFKKVGQLPVITHKEFRDKYTDLIQGHFGAIEGLNLPEFEGKDIIVLSQYNLNPTAYLLKAATLGINLEGKNLETKYQRWSYNGYDFHYEAYKDPEMRKVQFSCIEAEMLQVIGRARHLRHDVTVHYFGNFPLPQAILVD